MKIKYRFEDDPEDMVRVYEATPAWDANQNAFTLIPADAFAGSDKSIVLLELPDLPSNIMGGCIIEEGKVKMYSSETTAFDDELIIEEGAEISFPYGVPLGTLLYVKYTNGKVECFEKTECGWVGD
jgi:hypothetical protein